MTRYWLHGTWQEYDQELTEFDIVSDLAEQLDITIEEAYKKLAELRDEAMIDEWEIYNA
jgi:hypothetical protein